MNIFYNRETKVYLKVLMILTHYEKKSV